MAKKLQPHEVRLTPSYGDTLILRYSAGLQRIASQSHLSLTTKKINGIRTPSVLRTEGVLQDMEKQLSVSGALTHWLLKEHRSPVVSIYDLGVALVKLYAAREYAGQKIKNIRAAVPRRDSLSILRRELTELGILEPRRDLPGDATILVSSTQQDTIDIACGLDPFCFVSHLSAMEYHGLTDRFAKTVFITTSPPLIWKVRAQEKMRRDLGDDLLPAYLEAGFPPLVKHSISHFGKQSISITSTKFADQGSYIAPQDRAIRVSTLGRTFIDMLRKPDLCGGMKHVLDVYLEHARTYLPLIIGEVDQHGDKIEKVRAGYILEEVCGIRDNSTIESWVKFAQRGGSRLLDPTEPYWPSFSERWCLSTNVAWDKNE